MSSSKHYIGDGVYATLEDGRIKLSAEDGVGVLQVIYLEYDVYQNLVRFIERVLHRNNVK
jgi:hypothetical protein